MKKLLKKIWFRIAHCDLLFTYRQNKRFARLLTQLH